MNEEKKMIELTDAIYGFAINVLETVWGFVFKLVDKILGK